MWVESGVLVTKPGGIHTRSFITITRLEVLQRMCLFQLPNLEPQSAHPIA
jgi:hypothetical protein